MKKKKVIYSLFYYFYINKRHFLIFNSYNTQTLFFLIQKIKFIFENFYDI